MTTFLGIGVPRPGPRGCTPCSPATRRSSCRPSARRSASSTATSGRAWSGTSRSSARPRRRIATRRSGRSRLSTSTARCGADRRRAPRREAAGDAAAPGRPRVLELRLRGAAPELPRLVRALPRVQTERRRDGVLQRLGDYLRTFGQDRILALVFERAVKDTEGPPDARRSSACRRRVPRLGRQGEREHGTEARKLANLAVKAGRTCGAAIWSRSSRRRASAAGGSSAGSALPDPDRKRELSRRYEGEFDELERLTGLDLSVWRS